MAEIGIITTYASGVDVVFEWKIENFFNLPERDGAEYCSPDFSFGGERWYLCILPNGFSGSDSDGHVDLGLLKWPSHRSIKQSFSLYLETVRGGKYNEQHVTKDFDNLNRYHEFNRFISRSELSRRRSDLAPEGTLTVICTMESSTSAGSDRNTASTHNDCCHSKITFNADSLSLHRKKCMRRSIKSPDCLEVVVLRTWIDEHECQQERPEGTQSLFEDYKKVLFRGRDHNLILNVGDKEFRAQRDILRARSRVFESMLDHDMKEKNTGVIDVPDCDPNAMELFLLYVYCEKIEALDHNNMLGLYYVSDKYEMMVLKRECCNFIKKSLSLTNICSVIQLALQHSDSDLLEYATGYFSDNLLDIMQTMEWQSFHKDNFTVGNELLMKSIKKLKAWKIEFEDKLFYFYTKLCDDSHHIKLSVV